MPSFVGRALSCSIAISLVGTARAGEPAPSTSTTRSATPTTPATLPSMLPEDRAGRARDAFSEGLRLAEAGEYAPAESAFTRAYELEPHPLALYNIGQCQARLGHYAAAVQTLRRFLDQGGDGIDPGQQRAVRRQMDELRVRIGAREADATPSVSAPPPATAATLPLENASAAPPAPLARPRSAPAWGWLLGGSGLAILGSATVLYLWNDGRYVAWKSDRAELEAVPGRELLIQQDAAVWDRTHASNERLASIHRIDVVSAIAAGVGSAALGLGIWQLFAGGDSGVDASKRASVAPLAWRVTW